MKIKILFAIGRLSAGGAEKLLVHQLRTISKDKFDAYLLTLFPEQKESLEGQLTLAEEKRKKFNFHYLLDLGAWWKLCRFLKEERFDIVVTSLFSANLIVRAAAILAGVPAIVSFEHNLYPDKRRWQIWTDRILAKYTRIIFTDAEAVKKFTAKQERIGLDKFSVLYHPPLIFAKPALNREDFLRKFNIPANAKLVLTVSRLVEEKGHRYLIQAAAKVLEKFNNVYFIIVGWGPLEMDLKLQITNYKLQDKIILPGRMDIKDVLPYADIYIEPAIVVDIGIALLEAMKEGRPIIASRVGEIPVFVKEGENGFLIEPKNSDLLAEKILRLLDGGELVKKFGERSKEIIAPYTIENYMKIFESALIKLNTK
ncbi:MAG: glycosyltransferase [bacterium]|nr:glycosyltransferase [bacterium]